MTMPKEMCLRWSGRRNWMPRSSISKGGRRSGRRDSTSRASLPRTSTRCAGTASQRRIRSSFKPPSARAIRLDAYQLEPLKKALQLPRVNLFIADDVGLGKTIEAGLIATELLLRRRVREVVVVCPPSMLKQWQEELDSRFGLRFEILDRE